MSEKLNIVEELSIKNEYFDLAVDLHRRMESKNIFATPKLTISIGGESGSGKSTTAYCLKQELSNQGISSVILHMDSYFKLPPKDNHKQRIESLDHVGPQEVDLNKLNDHLSAFRNGSKEIHVPIVSYEDNTFTSRKINLDSVGVMIIEGVYSFLLENLGLNIFLERTYKDTFHNRVLRTRENHEPLIESILEIEHKIVRSMRVQSDYIIDKEYSIVEHNI